MNDINKKLDEYVKRRRIKIIAVSFVGVVLFASLLAWLALKPVEKIIRVVGTVTQLTAVPSDDGNKLLIIVRLENGEFVRASISNRSSYKKGHKVILSKYNYRYRFVKYVE